jgi:hypothetical protein
MTLWQYDKTEDAWKDLAADTITIREGAISYKIGNLTGGAALADEPPVPITLSEGESATYYTGDDGMLAVVVPPQETVKYEPNIVSKFVTEHPVVTIGAIGALLWFLTPKKRGGK